MIALLLSTRMFDRFNGTLFVYLHMSYASDSQTFLRKLLRVDIQSQIGNGFNVLLIGAST